MNSTIIIFFIISSLLLSAASAKWSLPFNKSFLIILISAIVSFGLIIILESFEFNDLILSILFVVFQFICFAGIILYLFFRDPKRFPPNDPNAIVSPADGTIIYIKKIEKGELLRSEKKGNVLIYDELRNSNLSSSELWQIGISLLFTDVHINRSPISGKVTLLNHRSGKFLSLRHKDAVNVNERQSIIIENSKISLGLVQIASRLVRRIESYIHEDEEISIGQKIGMIKFGSQVDVFMPVNKVPKIVINTGDYIIAGETVIGIITKEI